MSPEDQDHELSAKIAALPREVEPTRELWQGVASRIQSRKAEASRRRRAYNVAGVALIGALAAAAAYLVVARGALPKDAGDVDRAPVASVAPAPPASAPALPPAALVPEEESYRAALAGLRPTFESRRLQLRAEDARRIDVSLHAIETAVATTRAALTAHPDDPDLRAELGAEYEQEIQTMNDVLDWTTRS